MIFFNCPLVFVEPSSEQYSAELGCSKLGFKNIAQGQCGI